jgi:hypothetical protein
MDEEKDINEFDKLLQIQQKLDSLHLKYDTMIQLIHNNDLLLKQIVNRLNGLMKAQQINTPDIKEIKPINDIQIIKKSEEAKVAQEPLAPSRRGVQSDGFSNTDIKNGKDLISSFVIKEADDMSSLSKKNSVMQLVQDFNKKIIFMASVEIFGEGKLIYTTKTNASGFWSALLTAGNYEISISKKNAVSKKTLTFSDKLIINDSLDVINLKTAILQ